MAFDKTRPPQSSTAVTPKDARALLSLITRAAEAAAHVIRDAEPRRASLNWQEKGAADFVTEVDIAAEQMAMEIIRMAQPDAAFVAEESSPNLQPPIPNQKSPIPNPAIANRQSPIVLPSIC